MNPNAELNAFKTQINLSAFAASLGYTLDRRASSRHSAVMRHPKGDKIVIARNDANGHWIYFSVHDHRDHGTIIDFLQHRCAATRLAPSATAIIATDNDDAGDALAEAIAQALGQAQRPDLTITRDRPTRRGQDWNDVLQVQAKTGA